MENHAVISSARSSYTSEQTIVPPTAQQFIKRENMFEINAKMTQ